MNVKLFYETHGRFPSAQEFRLLKEATAGQTVAPSEADTAEVKLIEYARMGNLEEVKRLVPRVSKIDAEPNKITALAAAAQANQYGVVEFLIESKADVNFRTGQQRLPILYAAESGHFQVMNLLIQNGATAFSSFDQQLESYFVSYLIRQGITKRELSAVIPNETAVYTILDYVGLGTQRKPTAVQPQAPLVQGVGDPAAMAAAAAAAAGAQAAAGGPVLMAGGVPAGVAPGPGFEGVAAP